MGHRVVVALMLQMGCGTLHPERDQRRIDGMLDDRGVGGMGWTARPGDDDQHAVAMWMASPMTADSAVRTAMLRSPALQRQYAQLGIARAEILEGVQTPNPTLSASYQETKSGDGARITLGASMPLAALLALPFRARLSAVDYTRAKRQMAGAIVNAVADVEGAWYRAAAAGEIAELRRAAADSMTVSAELARRFYAAGNISERQLRQEEAAATQARIDAVGARSDATAARMDLDILIGLRPDETRWTLEGRLPVPPDAEDDTDELARLAAENNLARMAARQRVDVLRGASRIERSTAWLGDTSVGYEAEREPDNAWLKGPAATLELPLFNQGQARIAGVQARLAEARAELADIDLRSDHGVRAGAAQVRLHSEAVLLYRNELVPQRRAVVSRMQQEQGFMLIGIFELIQAKNQEYDAYQGYVESVRDYWLARTELMRAVGARLPTDAQVKERMPRITDLLRGPAGPAQHEAPPAPPQKDAPAPPQKGPPHDHSDHGKSP